MTSKLYDTEPGGEEQNQYETAHTSGEAHSKSQGQLGGIEKPSNEAKEQQEAEKKERGEQTAESIRYGQTISEQGIGGQTTDVEGSAEQRSYGDQKLRDTDESTAHSRREQQYGPGSGVGA